MPDPFGMRWFGLYAIACVGGAILGIWLIQAPGFGTLVGQAIFVLLGIGGSQFSRPFRQWMCGHWRS